MKSLPWVSVLAEDEVLSLNVVQLFLKVALCWRYDALVLSCQDAFELANLRAQSLTHVAAQLLVKPLGPRQ